MATWISHLRIAEKILKKGYNFEPTPFLIGNIGPDSGVPNENWSSFSPPKTITHWVGQDNKINAQSFWNKYLNNKGIGESNELFSFKIGYFVHLLTDIEWSKLLEKKKNEVLYKEGLEKDQNFIWTIKKDWYGLDYKYLEKHPHCIFNTLFKNINKVPDYLDYFPHAAFEKQVKYINEFYFGENNKTKENFIYLREDEMDNFIYSATEIIDNLLIELSMKKTSEKQEVKRAEEQKRQDQLRSHYSMKRKATDKATVEKQEVKRAEEQKRQDQLRNHYSMEKIAIDKATAEKQEVERVAEQKRQDQLRSHYSMEKIATDKASAEKQEVKRAEEQKRQDQLRSHYSMEKIATDKATAEKQEVERVAEQKRQDDCLR
ncbi:zinc dependent phospholipase C family protein [Clostridium algoriphilum]|uniref:zinc dependent phospholipase C family protein n=1 Tax=Clostridium algoriphilum TaxID=198347 RepID=UPI001CF47CAC|nr:zinc dependent phospholipase C family protein [Clostridium algoriphilum]MCB2295831.1 zinc dependent phospholipase C family protein [Clostridium algoriphilum]